MEKKSLGRYYHPETRTNWQVVEWGQSGSVKNLDENRLTEAQLTRSTLTTFAIVYPNGEVNHLTFSGVLPSDLDDLAAYWIDHESL